MSSADDEFDDFDFPEITTEDLARIDAQAALILGTSVNDNEDIVSHTSNARPPESVDIVKEIVITRPVPEETSSRSSSSTPRPNYFNYTSPRARQPKYPTERYTSPEPAPSPPTTPRANRTYTPNTPTTTRTTRSNSASNYVPINPGSTSYRSRSGRGSSFMRISPRSFNSYGHHTLLRAFRPSGYLSVSDLVGPSWCEVKFDYNLRWAPRHLRAAEKPNSVVTRSGKEIPVKKASAQRGEAIRDAGTAVHKVLEKELQPVEVEIPVNTLEERWGSKLLAMLSGVQLLKTVGYCREFPVVGFVEDVMVLGVIDEIRLQPIVVDEPMAQTGAPTSSQSPNPEAPKASKQQVFKQGHQTFLNQYFRSEGRSSQGATNGSSIPSIPEVVDLTQSPPSDPAPLPTAPTHENVTDPAQTLHTLHILDYKTRTIPTAPPPRDQTQSKLQLMLYKRLLAPLFSPSTFIELFSEKLKLDTSASFSPAFLQSMEYLCVSNGLGDSGDGGVNIRDAMCLGDLMIGWIEAVEKLQLRSISGSDGGGESIESAGGAGPVDDELELVYRLRARPAGWKKWRRRIAQPSPEHEGVTNELEVNALATGESARETSPLPGNTVADWNVQESMTKAQSDINAFGAAFGTAGVGSSSSFARDFDLRMNEGGMSIQEVVFSPSPSPAPELEPSGKASIHIPLQTSSSSQAKAMQHDSDASNTNGPPDPVPRDRDSRPTKEGEDEDTDTEADASPIVARSKFKYDAAQLDRYLTSILGFWRNERAPVGVEIEDANRSCEFRDECEWRDAKAAEFRSAAAGDSRVAHDAPAAVTIDVAASAS
ncbi:hypothetical protein DL93DRAFT_2168416 [Clavulina sp. PMI_390]|nr:hypothetical protein DL93DRAFT_2168416 [Clavulina sp. PMI_390]